MFESPWLLIPVLVVVEYILIVLWLRRRTNGARRAAVIGLIVCIALPIIQKLVVTKREQVRVVTDALIDAAEDGDVDIIARQVHARFSVGDIDRDRFIQGVESALSNVQIEEARITGFEVETTGDTATVRLGVLSNFVTRNEFSGMQPTTWVLTYEKTDQGWMLIAVEPRPSPVFPYKSLADIIP